jgi:glycine oxidase
MEKDYLIVGQGIAGSVLAFSLIQQGKRVLLLDENNAYSSSKVAAGLYNPIVFKRIVKSWMVNDVLPMANELYAKMEEAFGKKFHFKREIVKLFISEEERSFWNSKSAQADLSHFLSSELAMSFHTDFIHNPYGCSFVKQSGYADVNVLLDSMKNYLIQLESYQLTKFDFDALTLLPSGVEYKGIKATKILFCEGYKVTSNPYFNWLPMVLTKGEILQVRIPNFECEKVVNKGVFILPLGGDLFKVGATYEWKDLSESPTERGKSELVEKLKQVIKVPFEVVAHEAGVRPTVKDRRPVIGMHPDYPQLGIFNGMGTKAVLLAPYFALEFCTYLEGGSVLNKEVDVKRFYPTAE